MKKVFLSVLCFIAISLSISPAFCQAISTQDYDVALAKYKAFYNNLATDSIYNLLSDRIKSMLTAEKMAQSITGVFSQYGEIQTFEPMEEKGGLKNYKTTYAKGVLVLVTSINSDKKFEALRFMPYLPKKDTAKSNFTLKTSNGDIYGTLSIPKGDKKVPVVLVVAGSGPTDRDGNSHLGVNADTYKMIADSLLKAGIACLRYDKRGVGESAPAMKKEEDLKFDDYINDAIGFIKMLKADTRFSKVFVLGHSEGSLVGMVAASKEKVDGYISLAGAGERTDKVLKKQFYAQSKELGNKAALKFDSLLKGMLVSDADTALSGLFHSSVQPYLISWFRYDPQVEIKKVTEPVLIIHGTTDIQVGKENAEMLKKANPKATLKFITGMNHVLKQAPEERQGNIETYSKPSLPLCAGLSSTIVKFVKK